MLTFFRHASDYTLLEPTVLASVPRDLVDDTIFVLVASILHVFLNASTEEALKQVIYNVTKIDIVIALASTATIILSLHRKAGQAATV